MTRSLAAIFLLFSGYGFGQHFSDPDLQSLVDAERSFSRMAKDENTRDAFLHFLASDAVTASPGNGPRKGKKHLEEQSANDSWLYWEPVYSDIAASGDFGFTLGPWEFRQTKTDAVPVAFGHFVSMWKKNDLTGWKVAIDIGVSHNAPKKRSVLKTSAIKLTRQPLIAKEQATDMFNPERMFITAFVDKGNAAYDTFLSDEVKFFRPGSEPYDMQTEVKKFLNDSKIKVIYNFIAGDMASSGDLAYVYGEAYVETIRDGIPQITRHSYMRFWKKEDGINWKIVVDLLSN